MIRAFYFLFTLLLIFMAPWWVILPFIIIGMLIFDLFWEALILGLIFELLYGVAGANFVFSSLALTTLILLLLSAFWHIKQNLMLYN